MQLGIGGLLLGIYTFAVRGERIPASLSRRAWLYLIAIGIGNFAIVRVVFVLALSRLPATTHAYLVNFVGIVTMLISAAWLREAPRIHQIGGRAARSGRTARLLPRSAPPSELSGIFLVGIGVLTLATTNNLTRKLGLESGHLLSNNVVSALTLLIGGLPVVAAGLVTDGPLPIRDGVTWGIVLFNAVIGLALGVTVFNRTLRTLRSYEASVLATTGVVLTPLFAVPILGETLDARQAAGIAMMLAGVALVQIRRSARAP